MLKHKNNVL